MTTWGLGRPRLQLRRVNAHCILSYVNCIPFRLICPFLPWECPRSCKCRLPWTTRRKAAGDSRRKLMGVSGGTGGRQGSRQGAPRRPHLAAAPFSCCRDTTTCSCYWCVCGSRYAFASSFCRSKFDLRFGRKGKRERRVSVETRHGSDSVAHSNPPRQSPAPAYTTWQMQGRTRRTVQQDATNGLGVGRGEGM